MLRSKKKCVGVGVSAFVSRSAVLYVFNTICTPGVEYISALSAELGECVLSNQLLHYPIHEEI